VRAVLYCSTQQQEIDISIEINQQFEKSISF
jgi:hypothetical protein